MVSLAGSLHLRLSLRLYCVDEILGELCLYIFASALFMHLVFTSETKCCLKGSHLLFRSLLQLSLIAFSIES